VSEDVAAVTYDSEKQLAWEARHRTRAGIAASVGAIGLLLYFVLEQVVLRDIPESSGLQTLLRAVQPGSVNALPSLRIPYFEYLDTKLALLMIRAVAGMFGFIGLAWAAGFLGVATRARTPSYKRYMIYLPIIGGVVTGVGVVLAQIGTGTLVNDFLAGPRRVENASLDPDGLSLFAGVLTPLGSLLLAVGLVLVSLNAMRCGLLTKLFGYVGIAAGAMLVVFPLPIIQVFWIGGIGLLLLGRMPGGTPPAWITGQAEPWPTGRPMPGGPQPAVGPAPAPRAAAGQARRKRKKRG
jgi:hypothetical protein